MKISRIEIQDFQQFKNLNIDLTYPQGHAKAGQPLDKVCIIGQNGTGKTTILKLIHDCCLYNNGINATNKNFIQFKMASNTYIVVDNKQLSAMNSWKWVDGATQRYISVAKKLIYAPTNSYTLLGAPLKIIKDQTIVAPKSFYFQLVPTQIHPLARYFYNEFEKYNHSLIDYSLSIFNNLRNDKNANVGDGLEAWIRKNPNPLDEIANFIDKLLESAGLKLKTNVDKTNEVVEVQLVSLKTGETIPFEQLSSGTKNIFWTAYALYQQIENESIILIDEPENSLYPNLQRAIVPTYTSLRPDAETQFFFATHSPVIASCFEPWEIVDLELDDDNHVVRHLYYEGENHVDNYTIYPQYLRWDSIMNKVFDIKDVEGGELREEELQKMVETKNRLDYWKSEGKTAKTDERMREELEVYKKLLAKLY